MNREIVLASHVLCPYVQRAAIVLAEKNVPFTRRDVDLANKPQWFKEVSPLGKTPVLLVPEPIFESAVICEYLDDTLLPRLHASDPLLRARHRGWMEFGSAVLNDIAVFYTAADEQAHARIRARLGCDAQGRLTAVDFAGDFNTGAYACEFVNAFCNGEMNLMGIQLVDLKGNPGASLQRGTCGCTRRRTARSSRTSSPGSAWSTPPPTNSRCCG